MKRFVLMTIAAGLMLVSAHANAADNKKAVGTWKLSVPEAPYEYSKSTMTVAEAEGQLLVKIAFQDGTNAKAGSASFANDELKFTVLVDGYEIPFKGKVTGNSLEGVVDTPDGTLSVKAERVTLIGSWDFSAPDAPYEYSTGKLIFQEKEGKTVIKVTTAGGYDVPVTNAKVDNLSFSFSVEVDYSEVKVTGKMVNGKLSAKAATPEGDMVISAVRTKAKSN